MGAPEAHPRAYGEYPPAAAAIRRARGSSPCIRGILPNLSGDIGTVRLIPVHTGNTLSLGHTHSFTSAHPRAYGEYFQKSQHFELLLGSSPCIRGILNDSPVSTLVTRLIPVHTGNTSFSLR